MGGRKFFMANRYSVEFKQEIIKKVMIPGSPGIIAISENSGVHHSTIRNWLKKCGNKQPMKSSKDWSPEKKLQAIVETSNLSEDEFGEYLRKHGLHSEDLIQWKNIFFEANRGPGRPKKDPGLKSIEKEKKELERDLRRKDKALAEMSARVILLKKSRLLWGEPEEDE